MSTAMVIHEYLSSEGSLDANKVISDYWMDYIAARSNRKDPPQGKTTEKEDLQALAERFGKRLEGVLETRKKLRGVLDQIAGDHQESTRPVTAPSRSRYQPPDEWIMIPPKRSSASRRFSPGWRPWRKLISVRLCLLGRWRDKLASATAQKLG